MTTPRFFHSFPRVFCGDLRHFHHRSKTREPPPQQVFATLRRTPTPHVCRYYAQRSDDFALSVPALKSLSTDYGRLEGPQIDFRRGLFDH
jgi:hypothetical protein